MNLIVVFVATLLLAASAWASSGKTTHFFYCNTNFNSWYLTLKSIHTSDAGQTNIQPPREVHNYEKDEKACRDMASILNKS